MQNSAGNIQELDLKCKSYRAAGKDPIRGLTEFFLCIGPGLKVFESVLFRIAFSMLSGSGKPGKLIVVGVHGKSEYIGP